MTFNVLQVLLNLSFIWQLWRLNRRQVGCRLKQVGSSEVGGCVLETEETLSAERAAEIKALWDRVTRRD